MEGAIIAEASLPLTIDVHASKHVPRVVWTLRGCELHPSAGGIPGQDHRGDRQHILRHEGQPAEDGFNTILIILDKLMRDAVGNHDVRTAKLVHGGIDLLPQDLVQHLSACKDHRAVHHLDVPLAEPVQVGSNTHTAACRVRQSERLLVRPARLTGDEAASLQALDAHAPLRGGQACPDDSIQYMPCLPVDTDRMRLHGLGGQLLHVGIRDVQVLEAFQEVFTVHPLDLYDGLQLFHSADPCP
mmetsp:Transcript_43991/g.110495  ORF Transcript_43991/g.110495 Transcript_43991/m.110495 type:complete len:243 (+) Transcript_43991:1537-2265(+)